MTEGKSLSQWRFEIKRFGKAHYVKFYLAMVGFPVSSYPRFYKALERYGDFIFFEAIVSSSDRTFDSDPLNYVLKVAHNKWKEAEEELDASEKYEEDIEKAKLESRRHSDELKKKLDRARRLHD
jgi:hypothetical protein